MLLVPSGAAWGIQSPQEGEREREPWVPPTAPGEVHCRGRLKSGHHSLPPTMTSGCQFPSRAACRTRVLLLTYNESLPTEGRGSCVCLLGCF